jgi:hypothetical protein
MAMPESPDLSPILLLLLLLLFTAVVVWFLMYLADHQDFSNVGFFGG